MTIKDYLDLITSAYQQKTKFTKVVTASVSLQVRIQDVLLSMIEKFDVDEAVGQQLDIIGLWVGVGRKVAIPIPSVYFSWDADASLGWDQGIWQGSLTPSEVTVLPDDVYRTLIKTKIAANRWDGTTDGAYAIWDAIFSGITILIQDNQNMTYGLVIAGGVIDTLTLALITGGYLPLRPEGVLISSYFIAVNTGPVFAWDTESTLLGGWDEGSWTRELPPT